MLCCTVSRTEHSTAQTREIQCTKTVLPQVLEQGTCTCVYVMKSLVRHVNVHKYVITCKYIIIILCLPDLKVVEVAHDHQVQVTKYVTEDLKLLNSYDTWHGNKHTK